LTTTLSLDLASVNNATIQFLNPSFSLMNLNSRVLLKEPQFVVVKNDIVNLKLREGYDSEDIMHTIMLFLGLFIFSFANITAMKHYAPQEFFQSWLFIVASILVFMALFYIWYKGYIQFNSAKKVITLKLREKKFFGSIQIPYQDMAGIHVDVFEKLNSSDKKYLLYVFSVMLKSGKRIRLLKVYKKKQGRYIKNTIADHLNIEMTENLMPLDQ